MGTLRRLFVFALLFSLFWSSLCSAIPRRRLMVRKRSPELHELEELFAETPPHCSKAIVSAARPSFLFGSKWPNPRMRLNVGVGHTVCFRNHRNESKMNSTSNSPLDILHTLTLTRLEQYYPITQRFRFAIPELETRCICECSANAKTCLASEFNFGKCPNEESDGLKSEACHRTFFPDQPNIGCPEGRDEAPRLCCELHFRPHENRIFTAVRLESPTTFAVLRYVAYEWNGERWRTADRRAISVHLDGSTQTQFLDSVQKLELTVTSPGQSSNQLEPGMYFAENKNNGYGDLRRQPLNEITEHNFEKLGWFRINPEEEGYVQGGFVLMDKIHKAKAENCLEQKYQSILDANYYINKNSNESTKFKLAEPLDTTVRWIRRARIVDSAERHAIVDANEGTNLEISLSAVLTDEDLAFVHNSSKLDDFTAIILVDRFSNSVLNLTVHNASGVLNGYLKHISDTHGVTIDSFTVTIPDDNDTEMKEIIVRVKPYELNSQHMVCLRPDEGETPEICRSATSIHQRLETNTVHNKWLGVKGICGDCNQFTMDGFMHFLNPANWVKGVHSVGDALMLLSDVVGYVFVILLSYLLVFKMFIPILRCIICPASLLYCPNGERGKK